MPDFDFLELFELLADHGEGRLFDLIRDVCGEYEEMYPIRFTDNAISVAVSQTSPTLNTQLAVQKVLHVLDRAAFTALSEAYEFEDQSESVRELVEKIDKIMVEKSKAVEDSMFEEAARLRGRKKDLKDKLHRLIGPHEDIMITAEIVREQM